MVKLDRWIDYKRLIKVQVHQIAWQTLQPDESLKI